MFIFATPRTVALTVSLTIHALLVLLLVLNKLSSDHQSPLFTARKEPQVIMLPSPRSTPNIPTQAHPGQQRASRVEQNQFALLAPPIFSEEEEQTKKSTPVPLGTEQGKGKEPTEKSTRTHNATAQPKPHSFSKARSAWVQPETTQEAPAYDSTDNHVTRQTAYTEKDGIATSFGKALTYHPNFNAMPKDQASATARGNERSLTTVVNQEFTAFKTKQYFQFVTYSIGYELNKQQILEAPCDVPRRLVIQVNLASSGKLLGARILSSDGMPDFNQAVLRAVTDAAPFRSFPTSIKEPNFTLTLIITPDQSVLAHGDSRARGPISFFVSNPYQS